MAIQIASMFFRMGNVCIAIGMEVKVSLLADIQKRQRKIYQQIKGKNKCGFIHLDREKIR